MLQCLYVKSGYIRRKGNDNICDAIGIPVSWLLFSSITEEDVPEEKRAIFNALREPMMKVFEK